MFLHHPRISATFKKIHKSTTLALVKTNLYMWTERRIKQSSGVLWQSTVKFILLLLTGRPHSFVYCYYEIRSQEIGMKIEQIPASTALKYLNSSNARDWQHSLERRSSKRKFNTGSQHHYCNHQETEINYRKE